MNIYNDQLINLINTFFTKEDINTLNNIILSVYDKYISNNLKDKFVIQNLPENLKSLENKEIEKDDNNSLIDCVITKDLIKIMFPLKGLKGMYGRNFEDDIKDNNALLIWKLYYIYCIKNYLIEHVNENLEIANQYVKDTLQDDKIIKSEKLIDENKENFTTSFIHISLQELFDFWNELLNNIKIGE